VIVGANGSGKSSLVKQLTALYAPSSGSILVDDAPIGSYRVQDLRRATACLAQDHTLFPLSIGENIGIGRPEHVADRQLVEEAAAKGGAVGFMNNLAEGYDTVLHPVETKDWFGNPRTDGPFNKILRLLERQKDVSGPCNCLFPCPSLMLCSGGEKQRLVAARTFMRIATGDVRLVVVDEPSSAMDPAGEYELFRHLREARQGKTMIFITHRFGHLVKHADLILCAFASRLCISLLMGSFRCMKDGQLVEQGTHQGLLNLGGEYAELYNIQAQAFV
jgi:ABC-type multidrug transport system fused ATPase/permease subunit